MTPLIIYIDMDDTLCDFNGAQQTAREKTPSVQFPQSQMDFYRALKPFDHAVEAMQWMLNHEYIEPHILTAPSVKNPLCYTEKRLWVADHLGDEWLNRLHISPRKDLFKGDILIDDSATGRGQEKFEGKLIQFGQPGAETWPEIIALLAYLLRHKEPLTTLEQLLSDSPREALTLDDEDQEWLNDDELDDLASDAVVFERYWEMNDPTRFVIRCKTDLPEGLGEFTYWNISDGTFGTDIEHATLFKELETALALTKLDNELNLEVVKVVLNETL